MTMQELNLPSQPRPADSIELYADASLAARFGLVLMAVGFGGFLLWAAIAPLDSGVPTQGVVSVDTKRKAVQHLSGGIIKEVMVREGDQVTEGQVLMVLDEDLARSNYQSVRQKYLGLRAAQSRLMSEQRGAGSVNYHPDLREGVNDPQIMAQIATQNQLLASRRAALRADLDVFEQSIEGQKGQLYGYDNLLKSRRSQLALLQEELTGTRELVKDGQAPPDVAHRHEQREADHHHRGEASWNLAQEKNHRNRHHTQCGLRDQIQWRGRHAVGQTQRQKYQQPATQGVVPER